MLLKKVDFLFLSFIYAQKVFASHAPQLPQLNLAKTQGTSFASSSVSSSTNQEPKSPESPIFRTNTPVQEQIDHKTDTESKLTLESATIIFSVPVINDKLKLVGKLSEQDVKKQQDRKARRATITEEQLKEAFEKNSRKAQEANNNI